eukprot:m.279693 g.279693  ORF g.279693 m.279693 type:complete len:513 (+) comp19389_c0_seq28:93-1631(+)
MSEEEAELLRQALAGGGRRTGPARIPLPGQGASRPVTSGGQPAHRSVPFRVPTQSEEEMFAEATGGSLGNPLLSRLSAAARKQGMARPLGDEKRDNSQDALVSAMATRLKALERQLELSQLELDRKNETISRLQVKIKTLSLKQADASSESSATFGASLHSEYARLQRQVCDMEAFLADYGMVWVGDTSDGEEEEDDVGTEIDAKGSSAPSVIGSKPTWSPDDSVTKPVTVDFDKIIHNIKELNALAGDGAHSIGTDKDGATRLLPVEPIPMALYSNGFVMFAGPFRSYEDPTAKMCVRDLTEGYFPIELKERYPNGIPIEVTDMRNQKYLPQQQFPGVGYSLGGAHRPSRLVETPYGQQYAAGSSANTDLLLSKLPLSVIRQGKVVDIRSSVAAAISSPTHKKTVTVVPTPIVESMKSSLDAGDRPKTPADTSTIQVKSETGKERFILKLRFTSTIDDLRKYIDAHRGSGHSQAYRIIVPFPRKELNNGSQTLLDAGLTPNGTVHLASAKK